MSSTLGIMAARWSGVRDMSLGVVGERPAFSKRLRTVGWDETAQ